MMNQKKWEKFEKILAKFRIQSLLIALIIIGSMGLVGTLAWENFGQQALNANFEIVPDLEVEVEKRIIDLDGNPTTEVLAGAVFVLYDVSEEPYRQVLTDASGHPIGPTFTTDEAGIIRFTLPVGTYCLEEIYIPVGFGPARDDDDEPIFRTCFEIIIDEEVEEIDDVAYEDGDEEVASEFDDHGLKLLLIRDDEEVERIYIYNREIAGDLIVEKEVINEDGSDLTAAQLAEEFTFYVYLAQDDRAFTAPVDFRIENAAGEVVEEGWLQTGDSFTLRHGWRAIIENLPIGVSYEVREEIPEGFDVSASGTTGDIAYGEEENLALFTNTVPEDVDPPEVGVLVLEKIVVGEMTNPNQQFEFTVTIDGVSQTVFLRHNQRWTSDEFPVGTPFAVIERAESGFISNPSDMNGQLTTGENLITFRNYVIPEEPAEEGGLRVSKTVTGTPPNNPRFEFELVLTNLPTDFTENGSNYAIISINGTEHRVPAPTWTHTFFLRDGEEILFDNIPAGVIYRVTETRHPDFTQQRVSQSGIIIGDVVIEANFVNEYNGSSTPPPVDGEIEVCKILTDEALENDTAFYFELWVDDELVHEFTVVASACYLIEDLPVGAVYRVREVNIPEGYRFVTSTREFGTITRERIEIQFINEYARTDIPVEKLWELNDQPDIDLPTYIVVKLLANGVVIQEVNLYPDEETQRWEHVFENLPRYDLAGELIVYTVVEMPLPGWVDDVEVAEDGGVVITNTAMMPEVVDGVEVTKVLAGDDPDPDEMPTFAFTMTPVGQAPAPEELRIYITGSDSESFGDITFTEAGTFAYVIREVIPMAPGNIEFDTNFFIVEFVVVANADGELEVASMTIRLNGDDIVDAIIFVNIYHEDEDPGPGDDCPEDDPNCDDEDPGPGDDCPEDDPECDDEDPVRPPPPPPGDDCPEDDPECDDEDPVRPPPPPPGDDEEGLRPPQSIPPQTGDDTVIMVWLMLIGLSSLALLLINIRRRMAHEE